jgi:DUF4097 and DUF4098 domain-containing protein YvlB
VRVLYPVLALALAFPALAAAESTKTMEESTAEVPAAGVSTVVVSNPRGRVLVRRGAGPGIRLRALKIARGSDARSRQRMSDETHVLTSREGSRWSVRVNYPDRQQYRVTFWDLMNGHEVQRVSVELEIDVPPGIALDLKSASGDLETEGIAADQTLETSSGDIEVRSAGRVMLEAASGDATVLGLSAGHLRVQSGDLRVQNVTGPLDARTSSGDLTVGDAGDSLVLETVSGDLEVDRAPAGIRATSTSGEIEVSRARGRVDLESVSGGIHATLERGTVAAHLETSSGDIRVRLAGLPCELDAQTSSGDIETAVAMQIREVTRRRVAGRVGSGDTPVRLRTSSGDIDVAEGE